MRKQFNSLNEILHINKYKASEIFTCLKLVINQDTLPLNEITIKDGKVFARFLKSSKIHVYHHLIDFQFDNGIYRVVRNTKTNIHLEWIKSA